MNFLMHHIFGCVELNQSLHTQLNCNYCIRVLDSSHYRPMAYQSFSVMIAYKIQQCFMSAMLI